jgi:hypothetical protein
MERDTELGRGSLEGWKRLGWNERRERREARVAFGETEAEGRVPFFVLDRTPHEIAHDLADARRRELLSEDVESVRDTQLGPRTILPIHSEARAFLWSQRLDRGVLPGKIPTHLDLVG